MHSVASKAVRAIAEGASQVSGLSMDELFRGSPLSLEKLNTEKWVQWKSFCTWLNYLDHTATAPWDWIQVGQATGNEQSIRAARPLFRMTASIRLAYWLAGKWFGPSQFPGISCKMMDLGTGQLQETLALQSACEPCPQVFKVFQGCLTVLPEAIFGLPHSVVFATYTARGAIYQISLPPNQTFWSQIRFFLQSLFHVRALFREIVVQQENLQAQSNKLLIERSEFQNLIDRFPDGVIIHTHGRIRYVNPCFASYIHCDNQKQLIGTSILDLVYPEDRAAILERIKRLNNGELNMNLPREFRFYRSSSSEFFIGECTSLTTIFEGSPAVAVVVRDVSDRKSLQAHMMLTDRMRDLGQLAAGVGHEVNNPLFYVMMKSESLEKSLRRHRLADEAQQVKEIQEGLQRIQSIVRQLKTFSRIEPESGMSLINLSENINSAISMARNTIEHRARLTVEIEDNLPLILGNQARLGQVFLNLLINAAQSIEPGNANSNWISVRVMLKSEDQQKFLVTEISDTGHGITEAVKKNLFQPFFTTKPVGEGTGLGLSISHSIVTQHGGRIQFAPHRRLVKDGGIDKGIDKGTVFQVFLPLPVEKKSEIKNDIIEVVSVVQSGRILLIDDDPDLLEVLESLIATQHKIVALNDASEALERIRMGEKFDCILCDLMMPNLGGVDFYEKLLEFSPEHCQRIAFMTGGSFTERTDRFLKTSGIVYREKPVGTLELMGLIQSILKRTGINA